MLFFAALFGRRKVENEIEKTRRDSRLVEL